MIRVKVCGISQPEHALAATEARADFIGMVFAPSRRRVSVERAKEIVSVLRGGGASSPLVVGVFANEALATVNQIARECNLDYVQLNGDETWEYCQQMEKPVIKALRVKPGDGIDEVMAEVGEGWEAMVNLRSLCLLDSHDPASHGGTGRTLDWELARDLAGRLPFILAGGLTPENVARAVSWVRPWGVDVSSGVETNGIKDPAKIKAFVEAARRADAIIVMETRG